MTYSGEAGFSCEVEPEVLGRFRWTAYTAAWIYIGTCYRRLSTNVLGIAGTWWDERGLAKPMGRESESRHPVSTAEEGR